MNRYWTVVDRIADRLTCHVRAVPSLDYRDRRHA